MIKGHTKQLRGFKATTPRKKIQRQTIWHNTSQENSRIISFWLGKN